MTRPLLRCLALVLFVNAVLLPRPGKATPVDQAWLRNPRLEIDLLEALAIRRHTGAMCGRRPMPAAGAIRRDAALDAAAHVQAVALADTGVFAHRPQGRSPHERVVAAGFDGSYRGEALAKDARNVAEALDAWSASPGHCRTLMDARADAVGVSVVNRRFGRGPQLSYWVVVLGARDKQGTR